jgi:hypothetical protein
MVLVTVFHLVVAFAAVTQEPSHVGSQTSQATQSVDGVLDGLTKSRERLLQYPGGLQLSFRVESDQRQSSPYFFFPEGLDGSLWLNWPHMKNDMKGKLHGIVEFDAAGNGKNIARLFQASSSFDFDTMTSVTIKDGRSVEIIGRRHEENGGIVFPFASQYFVEFSQEWEVDADLKSDYWLPNALRQSEYVYCGKEDFGGCNCDVIERIGVDKLWISPSMGFSLLRRELNWGVGGPVREMMQATDHIQLAEGIWIPSKIVREQFDRDKAGQLLIRLRIVVTNAKLGNVSDADVKVDIPSSVNSIKDYVAGTISTSSAKTVDPSDRLESAVRSARHTMNVRENSPSGTLLFGLGSAVVLLGVLIAVGLRSRI